MLKNESVWSWLGLLQQKAHSQKDILGRPREKPRVLIVSQHSCCGLHINSLMQIELCIQNPLIATKMPVFILLM